MTATSSPKFSSRSPHLDDRLVRSLLDAAPDGLVMTDETGEILLANHRTETLFGHGRGELVGRSIDELLPARLRSLHRAHRDSCLVEPRVRPMGVGLSLCGQRRDGTEFPVEINLSLICLDDEVRIVAAIRDITGRVHAEARHQRGEQELRVLEERERMARDLHDVVVQRLFATGMAAQSLHSRLVEPDLAARAAAIVDELDRTIREVRTAIFGLQPPLGIGEQWIRRAILEVVDDEQVALGFTPQVCFEGQLDSAPDDVARHLLAILREALSNVARHARATVVEIDVVGRDELVLRVTDNGVGLPVRPGVNAGNGLRDMTERARALGGTFTAGPGPDGGTTIECRLPTRPGTTSPEAR